MSMIFFLTDNLILGKSQITEMLVSKQTEIQGKGRKEGGLISLKCWEFVIASLPNLLPSSSCRE